MLLANPHLPWADFMLFYESQWQGPGVNIYGATLVGFPVLTLLQQSCSAFDRAVNNFTACFPIAC